MKKMKQILLFFLCAALVLPGCKGKDGSTDPGAPETEQTEETTAESQTTLSPERETKTPHAEVSYDAEHQMVTIKGTGDYDSVKIPEEASDIQLLFAQDDNFTLLVHLKNELVTTTLTPEAFPSYVARTERNFYFARVFMTEHSAVPEVAALARKAVDMDIGAPGFGFDNTESRTVIHLNRVDWDRDFFYTLSLIPAKNRGWEQMGFAEYFSSCLMPDSEVLNLMGPADLSMSPYYETLKAAGLGDGLGTKEELRACFDVVSRYVLEAGFGSWGSMYESYSLDSDRLQKRRGSGDWYLGDQKMSVFMAASFVGWLMEKYGDNTVVDFVLEQKDFTEAFEDSFDNVFEAWKNWLRETYEYVPQPAGN